MERKPDIHFLCVVFDLGTWFVNDTGRWDRYLVFCRWEFYYYNVYVYNVSGGHVLWIAYLIFVIQDRNKNIQKARISLEQLIVIITFLNEKIVKDKIVFNKFQFSID